MVKVVIISGGYTNVVTTYQTGCLGTVFFIAG